jgi:hypothetical protein
VQVAAGNQALAMRRLLFVATAVLLLTSCGKDGTGKADIGESCSEDSECAGSTRCISNGGHQITNDGLSCVETDTLCSITCTRHEDCASLGTGYICIDDCFQGSCLKGTAH